jgi:SOS-response transcriptional repressor LexA
MTNPRARTLAIRAALVAADPLSPARARLLVGSARDECLFELNPDYLTGPEVTIVLRMGGPGFDEPGVAEGDLVIADRRVKPGDGSLVIALIRGETTVRRFSVSEGLELLRAPDGSCERAEAAEILATVVSVIPVRPEL